MGSLMPGWDKASQVPKGYEEDYKNTPIDMQKLRSNSMEAVESPRGSYSATSPRGHSKRNPWADDESHKLSASHYEVEKSPLKTVEEHPHGWWCRMDSATYNVPPLDDDRAAWTHGSYKPQHDVAREGVSDAEISNSGSTQH